MPKLGVTPKGESPMLTRAILNGCKGEAFEGLKNEIERLGADLTLLRTQRESILKVQNSAPIEGLEEKIRAQIGNTCSLLANGTAQLVHEELRKHIEQMRLRLPRSRLQATTNSAVPWSRTSARARMRPRSWSPCAGRRTVNWQLMS